MKPHKAPLNILVLLNRVPYPLNDGGAIGTYNMVKGYADAGCRMQILTMNTTRHWVEQKVVQQQLGKFGKGKAVPIDNRITVKGALRNLLQGGSYIIQRFVSEKFRKALVEILQQQQFDIVYLDGLPTAAYIDTIKQFSRAKIAIREHNVEHVIWQRIATRETNPLKKWYVALQAERLKRFELAALQQCDIILAISNEDRDIILQYLPAANTLVLPAGMDISERVEETSFDVTDLCFIGAFDWMPNLQGMEWFAAQIWPGLSQKFPQLKITVAGKKMPESIKALCSPSFIPAGEVPDARQFLLSHGVMLVPIISGSGIRIKILEAMALGKAVIATTLAAEGLGLKNGYHILLADTLAEFESQVEQCLGNPQLVRNIGQNAHKFALENFQNKTIFKNLVKRYTQLIE